MSNDIGAPERYRGATAEIAARLQARQQSYVFFATSSAALLGFLGNVSSDKDKSAALDWPVLVLPSLLGLAFACWVRNHDLIISMLTLFCRFAEGGEGQLSWYGRDGEWQKAALAARKWSDFAFSILAFLLCQSSVFMAKTLSYRHAGGRMWVVIGNYFCFGLTMWVIWSVRAIRWDLFINAERDGENGFVVRNNTIASAWTRWLAGASLLAVLALSPFSPFFSADRLFESRRSSVAGGLSAFLGFLLVPTRRGESIRPILTSLRNDVLTGHSFRKGLARSASAGSE